jgi:hypothetical protein
MLGTPMPDATVAVVARHGPAQPLAALMDALWSRGLAPAHSTAAPAFTPAALAALYVRAHWLRMPPLLLARHLGTKALMPKPKPAEAT